MTDVRAVASAALERYAISDYRLTRQSDSFNTLLRVTTPEARYVLRVGPPHRVHARGAARAEQAWTDQLAGCGLRVPRVVPSATGRASELVESAEGTHECSLLTWVPGRALVRPVADDEIREIGTLSARLHEASPPLGGKPPGALDGRRALLFDVPRMIDTVEGAPGRVLSQALAAAQETIDRLWDDSPPRLIHTDLTPANIVRSRRRLVPIDFQDLAWGQIEQDLAGTVFGVTRGENQPAALAALRSGYEQIRPWPTRLGAHLPRLIAARRLTMVNLAIVLDRPGLAEYVRHHAAALT